MLPIRTVVHPIDFAPSDRVALLRSAHVARHHGAVLHVIHVATPMRPSPAYDAGPACAADAPYEQAAIDREAEAIRAFAHAAGVEGVRVEAAFVPHAVPAAGIVAYARAVDADLIVTCAPGGCGPWTPVAGQIAERLVCEAPCPVLVVRPERPVSGVRRVVAALDLTSHDDETAAYAAALAGAYDVPLELLHSAEGGRAPSPGRMAPGADDLARLEAWAEAELRALCARVGGLERASVRVEVGFARDVITANAVASGGQLLVLGRRGPEGRHGLTAHGVTENALREAACSVFVVTPDAKRLPGGAPRPTVAAEPVLATLDGR